MKIIKIFLASSEELDYDRNVFGNLVRRLDDIYEKRGVRIKLFEWEDYDAAYNDRRKQDEYNDKVRESDIFLALFHKKAGNFTIEEFDVASEEFKKHASPKVFAFCKNLQPGENESSELADFKKRLFEEMGYFWLRYDSRDSLQFHVMMQLQLVENNQMSELKVEDGVVTMDGIRVAQMDKLHFVAQNKDYMKMKEEMDALPKKIEKARLRLEKHPDDEDLLEDLQQQLNKYNKLKEEFEQFQLLLFDTAKRVAQLRVERITVRMRRAIEAFEKGDVHRADTILDEAERDADEALSDIRSAKQVGLQSLEELIVKTSTKMADATIPIEERVEKTLIIYEKADALAKEIDYDKKEYTKLLRGYGEFLKKRNPMKAIELFTRQAELLEEVYGPENIYLAMAYDDIARIWKECKGEGNWDKAWCCLEKALGIQEKLLGEKHPDVAKTYRLMGEVQINRLQYDEAKDCIGKAIKICEETVGKKNMETALAYRAMGLLYKKLYEKDKDGLSFDEAAKNYLQAIEIMEDVAVRGEENEETLYAYNNLANLYRVAGKFDKALELHKKSLDIKERVLGYYNLSTAVEYNNMGNVYHDKTDYNKAMECYLKALHIKKKILAEGDYSFSNTYKRMGITSKAMGNYPDAEKYLSDALEIRRNQLKEGDERIAELEDELAKCKMRPKN